MENKVAEIQESINTLNLFVREFNLYNEKIKTLLEMFYSRYETIKDNPDHLKQFIFLLINIAEGNPIISQNDIDIENSVLKKDFVDYYSKISDDEEIWKLKYDYNNSPYIMVNESKFCNEQNGFEQLVEIHNRIVMKYRQANE